MDKRLTGVLTIGALLAVGICGLGRAAAQGVSQPQWTVQRAGPRFSIEGDTIRVAGGNGWIRAAPAFYNFVLRLQLRAVTEGARGAILIRSSPLRPGDWPGVGVRIPLDDSGEEFVGRATAYQGRIDVTPLDRVRRKATGEWSDLEIRAENDQITVSLDSLEIAKYRASENWAGYVGLAGDRGTMEYRRISVLPLTDEQSCADQAARRPPFTPNPRVVHSAKPRYLADAMARKAEGTVVMTAVVQKDGSVGPVCVVRSLDPDLDVQAVAATKRWRFEPYVVNSEPVTLRVQIELSFNLR